MEIVNLDSAMMNFLALYFPTEVAVKQKATERERLEESLIFRTNPVCRIS